MSSIWIGEATVMLGIVLMALLFAAVYAALEKVVPFLRGGTGRM
jgi:hypothetical protein